MLSRKVLGPAPMAPRTISLYRIYDVAIVPIRKLMAA